MWINFMVAHILQFCTLETEMGFFCPQNALWTFIVHSMRARNYTEKVCLTGREQLLNMGNFLQIVKQNIALIFYYNLIYITGMFKDWAIPCALHICTSLLVPLCYAVATFSTRSNWFPFSVRFHFKRTRLFEFLYMLSFPYFLR